MSAPVIETERLRLRPHRAGDFERLAALYATPRSRFVGGPLKRAVAWRNFAADVGQWDLLGFGAWAIDIRATGACAGQVALNFPDHFPERELGWLLWEEFEGHGYATEAARAARDFAYGTLGWTTAVSYIVPDNAASIRVAGRLGAVHDPDAAMPEGPPCLVYRHPPP